VEGVAEWWELRIADCGLRIADLMDAVVGLDWRVPPFQLYYSSFSSSWGYLSMVLKKAHPYGTDDFFLKKRGFYPG
jgi:hypothetical protein